MVQGATSQDRKEEIAMDAARIALVTGANQGVGLQVATELVANGLTVLLGSAILNAARSRHGRSGRAPSRCNST